MNKDKLVKANQIINMIENRFSEIDELFSMIDLDVQNAILDYHNEHGTMQHCIRYGWQAAKDIREDWHMVVSDIPCDRYVVRGCKETDEEDSCIDIVADDEAEFYGVYLIKDDGLEEWVADHSTKKEAEDFARKQNQK